MINWMSEKCNRLIDRYGISAIGFDRERDVENAEVLIEVGECENPLYARLGDVTDLNDDAIERRFAAAAMAIGIAEGIPMLVEFADRMLDPSDNGELEDPIPF